MRILLTAPPLIEYAPDEKEEHMHSCPDLALYLLAGVVEAEGHQVQVIDPTNFESVFSSPKLLKKTIAGIDLVGISVNTCTWPRGRKLILDLPQPPSGPLIALGGPHVNTMDEYLLRNSRVDYVVRSEAEKSFPALLRTLEKGQDPALAPGISFLRGEDLVRNPLAPPLTPEEMNELPLPKFELMPADYYDVIPLETSRGCLSSCIFCSSPHKRKWRGIKPEQVAERLSQHIPFLSRSTQKAFFLVDDCFTGDHDRLIKISRQLSGFSHPLVFEARIADLVEPGMLEAVSRLPIKVMDMGIESGYQEGLNRVRKKISLQQIQTAADFLVLKEFKNRARFSFVIGFPWETRKEIFTTLEFAFKLSARVQSRLNINWLTVFPGSPIFKNRERWGIKIEEAIYNQERWWMQKDFFQNTHPKLDLKKDPEAVFAFLKLLKELFPTLKAEGILRWY